MTKTEVHSILEELKGKPWGREDYLNKHQPAFKAFIDKWAKNNISDPSIKFNAKVWCFLHDSDIPTCLCCPKPVQKFKGMNNGWAKFCSKECKTSDSGKRLIQQTRKKHFQDTYGVDNPYQIEGVKDTIKKTNNSRYGVDNPMQSEDVIKELKIRNLDEYGVDWVTQRQDVKDKIRDTMIERYGSEHHWNHPEIRDKIKQTLIERYGVENPMQIPEVKERVLEKTLSTFTSTQEAEILDFLQSLDIGEIRHKDKSTLADSRELDFYLPEHNLAIEFNGLYWHCEVNKHKSYHLDKTLECQRKGIRLIHIWEDEWLGNQELVKSMITHTLGKTPNRVYARKCDVITTSNKDVRDFMNDNHIQGHINAQINYTLLHNDKIVAVMQFGKPRIGMGKQHNGWELLRYTNLKNHTIVGGASKLYKAFIREISPESVTTYLDRSNMSGGVYEKLGFVKESESKPNYWYIVKHKRTHRFNFRKSKLVKEGFDPNKTEHEIMFDRGIYRIYDCGTYRYRWEPS